jgi:hypothetical protein
MTKERRELRKMFAGRPTDQELRTTTALAGAELSLKTQEDNFKTQRLSFAMTWFQGSQIDPAKIPEEIYDRVAQSAAGLLITAFDAMRDDLIAEAKALSEGPQDPPT